MICVSPLKTIKRWLFAEVLVALLSMVVAGAAVLVTGALLSCRGTRQALQKVAIHDLFNITTRKPYDVLSPTCVIAFLSNYLQ